MKALMRYYKTMMAGSQNRKRSSQGRDMHIYRCTNCGEVTKPQAVITRSSIHDGYLLTYHLKQGVTKPQAVITRLRHGQYLESGYGWLVTKPQAVITRSSKQGVRLGISAIKTVTKPQAVITRSRAGNVVKTVVNGVVGHKTASGHHKVERVSTLYTAWLTIIGHKTASGHHKVEGRPENPHYRRLKKAFLKNKQTFFCRINKIRLHTMT